MTDEDEILKHLPTPEELAKFLKDLEPKKPPSVEKAVNKAINKGERNLEESFAAFAKRQEDNSRGVIAEDFIAQRAIETWEKDGIRFFILESPAYKELEKIYKLGILTKHFPHGKYLGYAKFPKLPGWIPGYRGIYTYIPVHGGITFFQEWGDGSCTYGFDCGHINSEEIIVNNLDWMRRECEALGRGVRIAARFEKYYLRAGDDNVKKARVLDRMQKFLPVDPQDNMGVIINLLGGEL